MTTSAFAGKATKAGTGEGGAFPIPKAKTHCARVIAMIDLGSHMEEFEDKTTGKKQNRKVRKLYIAFELNEKDPGGFTFVVGDVYNLSFVETSNLYKMYCLIMNKKLTPKGPDNPGDDIDYQQLLGQPCNVAVGHSASKDGTKTYANIMKNGISGAAEEFVSAWFKPQRTPLLWTIDQDDSLLPDWLPRSYGQKLTDIIAVSLDRQQADDADKGNETPSGDTGSAPKGTPDETIPF